MTKPILYLLILCAFQFGVSGALGEELEDDEDDVASASTLGVGGWVEFRPSYQSDGSGLHAENEAALQYGFTDNIYAGYTQEFRFEFLGEGYAWAEFSEIARAGKFSLGYEPRIYAPIAAAERKAGLNLATRQYVKTAVELNRNVSLFLWEVPVLSSYKEAGYETDDEDLIANPWFENRVELGVRLAFLDDKLKIRLPLIIQSIRHSNFDEDALNNDTWTHLAWVYPEATFQLAEETLLGVGYYSDTLMDEKFKQTNLAGGVGRGVFQLIVQQQL